MPSSSKQAATFVVVAACFWGLVGPLMHLVAMPPDVTVLLRFFLGGSLLALWLAAHGRLSWQKPTLQIWLALAQTASTLSWSVAARYGESSRAYALAMLQPVMTLVIAARWQEHRAPKFREWLLVILSLTGALLITRQGLGTPGVFWTDMLALGCSIFWALSTVLQRQIADSRCNATSMLAATFVAVVIMLIVTVHNDSVIPRPSLWQCVGLVALGLVTAVPYELFARAAGLIRASTAGMLLTLELVPPVVIGAIFLHERFDRLSWFGVGALVLAAIFASRREDGH